MRAAAHTRRATLEVHMIKRIRRVAILLAGVAGLLVLSAQAAHAGMSINHSEPLN
jgi:hypothetical protein